MGETENKEGASRRGESLIRASFSCLFCPGLNAIFAIGYLVLTSEPLKAIDWTVILAFFLWLFALAATYASPLFACLGIVLAVLGLVVSDTRQDVKRKCYAAVLLNVLAIPVTILWLFTLFGA